MTCTSVSRDSLRPCTWKSPHELHRHVNERGTLMEAWPDYLGIRPPPGHVFTLAPASPEKPRWGTPSLIPVLPNFQGARP